MANSGSNLIKLKRILSDKYLNNNNTVVAIIGAGCSYVSGMPPWRALKDEIIGTIVNCYSDKEKAKKMLWEKTLSKNWDLDPTIDYENIDSFLKDNVSVENICSVACESSIVTNALYKLFQNKYMPYDKDVGPPPQLAYELISHLFKHRYIDHIINFNFDELLDFAVKNEIGDNEFEYIITERDIIRDDNRNKPRLIKLHGTISIPDTLKFKSDDTITLSQNIVNLFDNTFKIAKDEQDIKPIDIISFGYSWGDYDFANYIYTNNKHVNSISIIQLENKIPTFLLNAKEKSNIDINIISLEEITNKKFRQKGVISIDQLLWALWKLIEKDMIDKPYVSVARHLLLSYLFGNEPQEPGLLPISFSENAINPVRRHTIENRFADEIILHLVKCKGMINVSVMAYDQRLNRYHSLRKNKMNNSEELPLDTFKCISQSSYPDVKETYFANAKNREELFSFLLPTRERKRIFIPNFNSKTKNVDLDSIETDKFINDCLTKIFDGPEVEIVTRDDNRPHWIFLKPRLLKSYYDLSISTERLIGQKWNKLFVIAETGEWLIKLLFNRFYKNPIKNVEKNKVIYMINASAEHLEEWHLRDQIIKELDKEINLLNSIGIKIVKTEISWWQHNRHLTLAFNSKTKKYVGGIYFRRRLKTSRVVPYLLDNASDCNELFLTFISHINRIENSVSDELIKDTISMIDLLKKRKTIKSSHRKKLQMLYEKLKGKYNL